MDSEYLERAARRGGVDWTVDPDSDPQFGEDILMFARSLDYSDVYADSDPEYYAGSVADAERDGLADDGIEMHPSAYSMLRAAVEGQVERRLRLIEDNE